MNQQIQILDLITKYLLSLNTAAPVIFGLVTMVNAMFKGITGAGQTLLECADIIERNLGANDTAIRVEIERVKAVIGITPPPTS